MELQSFDLLWLPQPIDICIHHEEPLHLHEAELGLIVGPNTFTDIVQLGHCAACGQWYGLLPVLEDLRHEIGMQTGDIEGFAVDDEEMTAGVVVDQPPLAWSTFAEQMDEMEAAQDQPTPTVEEVQALDQSSVTWELGQASAGWIGEEDEEAELAYVALVHDPNLIRSIDLEVGTPLDAEDLAALIRRAAGAPQPPGEPGRPRTIRIADEEMAEALAPHLDPLDIAVEVAETPLASESLDELSASMGGVAGPPVFQDAPEDQLRAFLDTAERFYEAEPWTRTEGDRFLGVQIDDEPWFFVNVMGQLGDTPGLTLFDDWPTVCRFIHNDRPPSSELDELASLLFGEDRPDAPDPFEAAGALEGITLHDRDLLHPGDADYLDRLSIAPPVNGQYPAPQRFEFEDGPVAPRVSLDTYRRVMEALLIALERRHATPVTSIKTTLDIDDVSVSLRYPSEGTERSYNGPPGYRLVLQGHDHDIDSSSRLPAGAQLVIEAPATALFKDIAKAAKKSQDAFYEFSLYDGNVCLWDDNDSRRNPSPRVADLVNLDEMDVELGGASFQFHIDHPLDTAPDDIRIQRQP